MIRKLANFEKSINSQPETDAAEPPALPATSRLGIAVDVDVFESAVAMTTDSAIFTGQQEVQNPVTSQPEQKLISTDTIAGLDLERFGLPWSPPSIPLKSRITSPATSIASSPTSITPEKHITVQTDAYHARPAGDAEGKFRTSIDHASLDSRISSPIASSIDSISTPAISNERLVEDLLRQIKQLLLTVPQDAQSYWKNIFEEKIKEHFYEARMENPLGVIGSSNIRYYPLGKDEINWESTLEDFQTFFQQLQAVQQPTQVQVAPPDVPPKT